MRSLAQQGAVVEDSQRVEAAEAVGENRAEKGFLFVVEPPPEQAEESGK